IHAIVVSRYYVIVFGLLSPVAKQGNAACEFGVIADDLSGLDICTEVLAGIKPETTEITDRPGATALVFGTMRLRGILDDHEVVAAGNLHNLVHVGHQAMQMDRQDRP